jgi:nitrous oxidase accessory protein NosD
MRSQIVTALLLLIAFVYSTPAPNQGSDCDTIVKPHQSIQVAIDNAKSGDKILVEAGEYYEQLTVTKDNIQLIGQGAILLPPTSGYKSNFCTGLTKSFEPENKDTEAGICIHGVGFSLAAYDRALQHRKILKTGVYINNVVVSGFEIRNFTGENIALIGGHDVRITHNKLVDGAQYGFLTVGSKGTHAKGNVVTTSSGLAFIAMCMDDESDTTFERNDISNYYFGLCTQTNGGVVKANTVTNCCYGPFVDPGIDGAKILENTISTRNPGCLPSDGAGIVVFGAVNTIVQGNLVEGFRFNNSGVGILVTDDPDTEKGASGNVMERNVAKGNGLDIFNGAKATDNVFRENVCESSVPVGLCGV